MVRNRINFFRNNFKGKILCKKPPEFIAEFIRLMRAISVMPDSTMGTHNYHAINKCHNKARYAEVFEYE